ncbi:MAG: 50S ribosomal protein L18e [Candidatus Pacearchaeota archaeon]
MKKTKIEKRLRRKTNKDLVETIILSKKNKNWIKIAYEISKPRRKNISLNLDEIDKISNDGEIIIIPGKVLGNGEINKKIKISAHNFSFKAKKKLKEKNIEINSIYEEIKRNPEAKGIKIISKK